jgi:dipeptidyl-peptidase 4
MDQTRIQSSLDIEAYPKAGTPTPSSTLFVYDLASGETVEIDVRDGLPFHNSSWAITSTGWGGPRTAARSP